MAEALGELGDSRAVPELIKGLDDPVDWVCEGVAEALGQLSDPQAVPALITALKERGQKTPRQKIAEALGEVRATAAVPVLIRALEKPSTYVPPIESESLWASVFDEDEEPSSTDLLSLQCGAAKALGSLRDRRAVTPLLNALQTKDEELRKAAAKALRELDDQRTFPALLRALEGNEPISKPHAAESLGILGDLRAVPALLKALEVDSSTRAEDYWLPASSYCQFLCFEILLGGVHAPEKGQPFGNKARTALGDKVFQQSVRVDVIDVDRYHREVGRIFLGDRFINMEMVSDGFAWRYVQYEKPGEFTAAENEAREHQRGLWAEPNPMPPWEWRKAKRYRSKAP